ncbi:MAG TPA: SpoIIE family protein phosphatase [Solirubrobacterales bacterium]|nr:SpoIIE family protein phosphatase [Solirubrobacterales bacterium]
MGWQTHPWPRVAALMAVIAGIFALTTAIHEPGPLFVIPVILAGYWFGPWGGATIAVLCAGLYAIGRVIGPEEAGLEVFPATVGRLFLYGAAGSFVGWLSESRVGLEREVRQQDRALVELRTIQEALSPHEPEPRPGLQLATCYLPAQDGVAGDFYLVTRGMDDSTVIAIGDVAGRGLEAAKRAWFVRTVLASSADFTVDPGEMLDLANYSLIEESGASSLFVTAACIVFHPRDGSIRWSVAGHEAPILLDDATPLSHPLTSGVPLGIEESIGCETVASSLSFGSGLLLYTDGVIEARSTNGAGGDGLFGEQRLVKLVSEMHGEEPATLVERIRDEVLEHSGGRLEDDMCLVALRFSGEPESEAVCDPVEAEQPA